MTKLDAAVNRFVKALERLELALEHRGNGAVPQADSDSDLSALRGERAQLAEELDAVKADFAALESVADEVETRLDGAIRDIQRVLNA